MRCLRKADPTKIRQKPNDLPHRFTSWTGEGTHSPRVLYNGDVLDETNLPQIWTAEIAAWERRENEEILGIPILTTSTSQKRERFPERTFFILEKELTEIRNCWLSLAKFLPQPETLADCTIIEIDLDPRIEKTRPTDHSFPSREGHTDMAPGSGVQKSGWRPADGIFRVLEREWRLWANAQVQGQNWRHSISRLGIPCKLITIDFKAILIIRLKEPFTKPREFTDWLCRFKAINAACLVRPIGSGEITSGYPL